MGEVVGDFEGDLKELRDTFNSGKTREASWRRSQLHGIISLLKERESDIFKALKQDLGKHHVEAYRDEIGTVAKSANYALGNLNKWMGSKRVKVPLAAFPSRGKLVPEPLGVVLIISSWNFPFGLSLEPIIGAIAAGNAVLLKPSEIAPTCSSVLAETIYYYLDNSAIKVVEGGPRVGQIVMAAAAKNLTPVTLELGGKCPAVVDCMSSSWDQKIAIKRIIWGKFGACAGQVCIGIDYILTQKKFAPTLVEFLKKHIKKSFGDNPMGSNNIAKIVNKKHFSRLKDLLNEPNVKNSIVYGGSLNEENLFIEPTILLDPPLDATIMTEEIFGPLLPIITLEAIEDSIQFIRSRPKPLAIYGFTNNEKLQKRMMCETSSGSITFNDAIIQYAIDTMPFGGVGGSGFGRYHGKYSFEDFSHQKAVLVRGYLIDFGFRYPPWNDKKLQLLKSGLRYNYLTLVLIKLGLKSKA
ncbi:Aldehyde dehydrogenase, C-terminal [Cynara cardunculus var. scolymus]|uniref:Aldehyde dehydrogenase n=1 Tax=Cynara cardunculus var. scolymus TaxID=59895 RepID=A0A103YHZ5_CYNCS|nr:Aldehyde dehydrogenase, C-terminal [Cynara cardunculus var. scolymus]